MKQLTLNFNNINNNINIKDNIDIGNIQIQGSKRAISSVLLKKMFELKPKATLFIDLFGGGGAMSFRAIQSGYKVIYNEYNKYTFDFIKFVINQIKNKKGSRFGILPEEYYYFVSKKEFDISKKNQRKTIKDIFNLIYYSFGSMSINKANYAFTLREDYKKEGHNLVIFNQYSNLYTERYDFLKHLIQELTDLKLNWRKKRLYYVNIILKLEGLRVLNLYDNNFYKQFKSYDLESFIKMNSNKIIKRFNELLESGVQIPLKVYHKKKMSRLELQQLEQLQRLQRLEQLEQLEQLQQLQQLQRLERLEIITLFNKSYIDFKDYLKTLNNDEIIIYCDPPYKNTIGYNDIFNYDEFESFLKEMRDNGKDIFISEYTCPSGCSEIMSIYKRNNMCNKSRTKDNYEKLFINRK